LLQFNDCFDDDNDDRNNNFNGKYYNDFSGKFNFTTDDSATAAVDDDGKADGRRQRRSLPERSEGRDRQLLCCRLCSRLFRRRILDLPVNQSQFVSISRGLLRTLHDPRNLRIGRMS
jgi:hypothetical protein